MMGGGTIGIHIPVGHIYEALIIIHSNTMGMGLKAGISFINIISQTEKG
jgi:hypothetical protein